MRGGAQQASASEPGPVVVHPRRCARVLHLLDCFLFRLATCQLTFLARKKRSMQVSGLSALQNLQNVSLSAPGPYSSRRACIACCSSFALSASFAASSLGMPASFGSPLEDQLLGTAAPFALAFVPNELGPEFSNPEDASKKPCQILRSASACSEVMLPTYPGSMAISFIPISRTMFALLAWRKEEEEEEVEVVVVVVVAVLDRWERSGR